VTLRLFSSHSEISASVRFAWEGLPAVTLACGDLLFTPADAGEPAGDVLCVIDSDDDEPGAASAVPCLRAPRLRRCVALVGRADLGAFRARSAPNGDQETDAAELLERMRVPAVAPTRTSKPTQRVVLWGDELPQLRRRRVETVSADAALGLTAGKKPKG